MITRSITLMLVGLLCAVSVWAAETKLAGIRIGMKPAEVLQLLGEPTAVMMAQPPLTVLSTGTMGLPGSGNMPTLPVETGLPPEERPNTLILIYDDKEIELGPSQDTSSLTLNPSFGGAPVSEPSKAAEIPAWAYVVRATKLSLGQQELIYKINDTYSIGVTITGSGAEARVTDVVACTFESFKHWPAQPTRVNERKNVDFTYKAAKDPRRRTMQLPAGTSKQIVIGSRLDEVLRQHQWPQYFFPYVTDSLSTIVLDPRHGAKVPNIPVKGGAAVAPGAVAPVMSPDGGAMSTANGEKPALFTDGEEFTFNTGFTKNALLLYLNDSVAITLVDFTVVRIQIGSGVVRPPDPPKVTTPTP